MLHRLTSYEAWREWSDPIDHRLAWKGEANDIDRLPWFFKRYEESLPRVALPRDLQSTTAPTVAALAGTADIVRGSLDLPQLSRLLHLSAGVTRTAELSYTTWLFRAAGSAGGRFPLELYIAVPEGHEVPAGVHWYHPLDHALVRIGPPPGGDAPVIVVTGIPWRTGWRYRERGYRHVYWDAGTMLAQLIGVADSGGLDPHLHTGFPDPAIAALVGADRVHEWPLAVVALGDGDPALAPTGATAQGEVDAEPIEFSLVTDAQRAGDRESLDPSWERGEPVDVTEQETPPIEKIVLARGSQRRMDPVGGLPADLLCISMAVALRGIDLPHFVVVHKVEGLTPGIYRWPDLSTPMRAGDMRDEMYRVCLEQDLGRDASFVVIAATDVGALDDRAYREAQLAAGLVEGRLHLLAYSMGAGASGMTFLDVAIPELLGVPLDGLLFTCVGVPEYASSAGGPPGKPTAIRMVRPRTSD